MGDRLIITDNREDPDNPLVLHGEDIDAAAEDPLAIGKLWWIRCGQREPSLPVEACTTNATATNTGGWVRVLAAAAGLRSAAAVLRAGAGGGGGGQSRSPAAAVAGASLALMGKAKAPSFLARLRGQLAQQLETDDPPMAPVQRG
jgi:hypothetical protein